MKFKDLLIIAPLALALVACGAQEDEEGVKPAEPAKISGSVVNNPPVDTGGGQVPTEPTGPTGPTSVNGCPANPTENIYYTQVSGTGPYKESSGAYRQTTSFAGRQIVADQKLRVSIKASGASNANAYVHDYSRIGMKVALVKGSTVLATRSLGLTVNSAGKKPGVNAGEKTDPALLDFSDVLPTGNSMSGSYQIRIFDIQTDYMCKTQCKGSNYGCVSYASAWYNSYGAYYAWSQNANMTWSPYGTAEYNPYYGVYKYCSAAVDYGSAAPNYQNAQQACCPDTMLSQCNKCIVAYDEPTAATWSVEVHVETDSTPCVQFP